MQPTDSRTHRPAPNRRPAVFLDRDGTLIEDTHYLVDPRHVRLLRGAAEALRRLQAAGFACVVVTNQSAIARGMLTEDGLRRVHEELSRQLAERGTALDGFYYCPEAPGADDPTVVEHPDRKPGPGMLLRAAAELGLDLGASWMIGDAISDALAGRNAGCRGSILVRTGRRPHEITGDGAQGFPVCADLLEAIGLILDQTGNAGAVNRPGDGSHADGCQPASAQSSPLTAELLIRK